MFHAGEDNLADMIGLVAQDNGHHLHVCHVNGVDQVAVVNAAQEKGLRVTSGVTGHHLLKTSFDLRTQGTFAEVKPVLADQDEAEQLMSLLDAGKIDIVETDFAPHTREAKFDAEESGGHCFGMPGIEHVLPLLAYQVKQGRLSWGRFVDATSTRPSEIIGVHFDDTSTTWSEEVYRIYEDDVWADCGWTPYMGMLALGRLLEVKIGGRIIKAGKFPPLNKRPEIIETRGHQVF